MNTQTWQGFLLWILSYCTCWAATPVAINSLSIKGVLAGQASGQDNSFKQVIKPREFHFPRDHLAHQAYKSEWWYFSGNMSTDALSQSGKNRNFSYQFTLFRFALQAEKKTAEKISVETSNWRSSNIYMAHIALTDKDQHKFYQQERFSRDALGLAGTKTHIDGSLQFWLNDWQIKSMQAEQLFPLQLDIKEHEFALQLQLNAIKPLVLQGQQGYSQKSDKQASYYYSYTRLASKGRIKIGKNSFKVTGNSWFDREWSTSGLAEEQQGWDWFALHLDDGSELMLYQMRKKDGSKDSYSSGILVEANGQAQTLTASQFQLQVTDFWKSSSSGIAYPINWTIIIPEQNIKLTISTQTKHQEWSKAAGFSFNYWEGSVEIKKKTRYRELYYYSFIYSLVDIHLLDV